MNCLNCNKEFIKKCNSQKYCKECGKLLRKKYLLNYAREYSKTEKYRKSYEARLKMKIPHYCLICGRKVMKTGYNQKYCSVCSKQRRKIYLTEYTNIWKEKNPERAKEIHLRTIRKDKKRHPERIKARQKANNQIKIPKNQMCMICNKNLAVEKHHDDYNKPLKVKFVCLKCHNTVNRTNKKKQQNITSNKDFFRV